MREYSEDDPLRNVDTTLAIVDDRIAMSADAAASLYVDVPDHQPLSRIERHATLKVRGPDFRANIELDADDLAELTDTLQEATDD